MLQRNQQASETIENRILMLPESFELEELSVIFETLGVKKGDIILDMFAGAGILGVAATMRDVNSISIESIPRVANMIKANYGLLREYGFNNVEPDLIVGDSESVALPPDFPQHINYIITSPPFTISKTLNAFEDQDEYYHYLLKLVRIFKRFAEYLTLDGKILVEIGNDSLNDKQIPLKQLFVQTMEIAGFQLLLDIPKEGSRFGASYLVFSRPHQEA